MIVVVCGPSASGKSALAQTLQKELRGIIVNADAFQIYQELQIGVNKPDSAIINEYQYHLIDCWPLEKTCSIAAYQVLARQIIENALKEGKPVIIEGGSGLYIKSTLYDYQFSPETDNPPDYSNLNNQELRDRLLAIDPLSAQKIHVNNRKRLIRALTVYAQHHTTKSQLEAQQTHKLLYHDVYFVALKMERSDLYRRIDERVEKMWSQGLLTEVEQLIEKHSPNTNAFQAIGYKEVITGLMQKLDPYTIKETIKRNTRRYAKRQITYFKHQLPVQYFDSPMTALAFIKEKARESGKIEDSIPH